MKWQKHMYSLICLFLFNETTLIKGALCSFWRRRFNQKRQIFVDRIFFFFLGPDKLKKNLFFLFSCLNKLDQQTNLRGQHNFILFTLFIFGGPRHFLASNRILGMIRSTENSLFIQLGKK